jgi:RNA ligase
MLERLNKYYEDGLLYKQVHPTLPLTIWNYSESVQYEKKWDEITLSCRGLVTDNDGNVVARPFSKFFNYEELTPEQIPNEYFVDIKVNTSGEKDIYKDTLQFQIVNKK